MRIQPKEVRDRHALIISLTFTGIIAGAWVFTLVQFDSAEQQQVAEDTQPPFSGLLKQFKDQWASLQEAVPSPDETMNDGQEAAVESQMSPTELRLTDETIERLRSESAGTSTWEGGMQSAEEVEVNSMPVQVVQIVTVSSTAAVASSTAE